MRKWYLLQASEGKGFHNLNYMKGREFVFWSVKGPKRANDSITTGKGRFSDLFIF